MTASTHRRTALVGAEPPALLPRAPLRRFSPACLLSSRTTQNPSGDEPPAPWSHVPEAGHTLGTPVRHARRQVVGKHSVALRRCRHGGAQPSPGATSQQAVNVRSCRRACGGSGVGGCTPVTEKYRSRA